MISRQGEKGPEWKYDLLPVYGIYLLNFSLPEFPSWRTDVVLANEQTGRIRLKQIYVSFERFDLRYEECVTPLEKTIYVLKNMETLKRLPFKARKSVFEKLEKIVDIASLSKEERMKYDESIKVYRDNLVTLEFAEQKGRAEGKEETARNLKKMGVSLEIISKATGLSIEKIEAL